MKKYFVIVLLVFLAVFTTGCANVSSGRYTAQTRTYYIAAENVVWDFAPLGRDVFMGDQPLPAPWGEQTKYQKTIYRAYTDDTFTQQKPHPEHLGILGPIIRAVEGDTVQVVFKNKTSQPYSMHPHGLHYDKKNEGIMPVAPGETFTYRWSVTEKSLPTDLEGSSKLWIYHSHVDSVQDIYDGLIGPIIVTKARYARPDGTPRDVDRELVNMFFIFNESTDTMDEAEVEGHLMHAINGYVFGNLPGLTMKAGERVRWHEFAMGTEVDLHTPHWHGETVLDGGIRKDVIPLLPSEMRSVDMVAENPGKWMYHCHVTDHITAGMTANYTIEE